MSYIFMLHMYIYIRVYLQRYVYILIYIYSYIYIYTFNWVQRPRQTFDQAACVIPASNVIALPLPVCVRQKTLLYPYVWRVEDTHFFESADLVCDPYYTINNSSILHGETQPSSMCNDNGGWGDMMQHNESKAFWQQVSFMALGPV